MWHDLGERWTDARGCEHTKFPGGVIRISLCNGARSNASSPLVVVAVVVMAAMAAVMALWLWRTWQLWRWSCPCGGRRVDVVAGVL